MNKTFMAYNNDTGLVVIGGLLFFIAGFFIATDTTEYSEAIGIGLLGIGLVIETKVADRFQWRLYVIERRLGIR